MQLLGPAIYSKDWDSYKDFAGVFDTIILECLGISANAKKTFKFITNYQLSHLIFNRPGVAS